VKKIRNSVNVGVANANVSGDSGSQVWNSQLKAYVTVDNESSWRDH
jgi:hypothetical protein